ncbi:dynamin family protein [Acinetobacter sp. YH16039]|uniref:dynamin family protein n=1 Tax=unclassified Acinetobacter TaxID=196816 RepID=UPI0015D1D557|nr:dynamin family protein [Acinetobacter sp. YH16039]
MFKIQHEIHSNFSSLENLYQNYQLDTKQLNELLPQIEDFKLRVPLIGAFSAGKSTLINTLIETKLLSTAIKPESNLATEISFHDQEDIRIAGYIDDIWIRDLNKAELKAQEFEGLYPDGHIRVVLNHPFLNRIPHLCLADLPGLESKSEAHMQAIHNYIGRSLGYIIVVSSDEGTLKSSIKKFLQELALHKAPVVIVINKSDKRLPEDIDAIKKQVNEEVKKLLKSDNYFEVVSASRNQENVELKQVLYHLEKLSEQRFKDTIMVKFNHHIDNLYTHLTILLNQDNLDEEKLQQKIQQLKQEHQQITAKLSQEKQVIQQQLPRVLDQVLQHVKNRLNGESDQYARLLIAQQSLEHEVNYSVRMAVTEALEQYYQPVIEKYIHRVENELPKLSINDTFHFEQELESNEFLTVGLTSLMSLLPIIFKVVPWGALVVPILGALLKAFMNKAEKEQQREQQRQQAVDAVQSQVIPQILEQVRLSIKTVLDQQFQHVSEQVEQQIKDKVEHLDHALVKLMQDLQQNQQQRLVQIEQYRKDLNWLQTLKQKLAA